MNVHYKIIYQGKEQFITLPPLKPFQESRVEQVFNYCINNDLHPNDTYIVENATHTCHISVTDALRMQYRYY